MTDIYRYPTKLSKTGLVATLGNFDGLHLGHQELLSRVQRYKQERKLAALLLSFYPHPDLVLGKLSRAEVLCPLQRKMELLGKFNIDFLYLMRFTTNLSKLSAADFIEKYLFKQLNVSKIVLGADASVGYKREGSPEFIKNYFERSGREAEIVEFKIIGQEKISSGRIRNLLNAGNVEQVLNLLGRFYEVRGVVVKGDGRGKSIGIPTANLNTFDSMLPSDGVYACICEIPGQGVFKAVTNIGIRPTFSGKRRQLETHLLEYNSASIYKKHVNLHFVAHIRQEQKFPSVEKLVEQIKADIIKAEELLRGVNI